MISLKESEIEIEIDLAPIRYKIELDDPKNFDKEMRKLKSFIDTNDEKLQHMASKALETRRKNYEKLSVNQPIECRLPSWFYKSAISLPEAIALLMYFVEKPLNTRQLTELVNRELKGKKKDLRNVSKHLTSRGKSLYGHTAYDRVAQTYALNVYGKKWVEDKLIRKLTGKADGESTDNNT